MFCKNCGNKLNDDAKFCPGCGTAVLGVEVENEVIADEKVEDNSALLDAAEKQQADTESSVENKPDEAEKDTVQAQPIESPPEPEKVDNEAIGNTNESNQSEASKSENSATDNIKEVLLPQKSKKGRVKFKDLPKKQKIIRIAIGGGLLLIALIWFISDGIAGADKAGFKKTAGISNEQALAVLYATSIFEGTGYETAVQYGSFRDVSIAEALDQGFEDPSIKYENGENCVYITISGMFYLNGLTRTYKSITYKVDEDLDVNVYKDSGNIEQKLIEWAGYLASNN